MNLKKIITKPVLFITDTKSRCQNLIKNLSEFFNQKVSEENFLFVQDFQKAREQLLSFEFSLVVIDYPIFDESAIDFVLVMNQKIQSGIIIFCECKNFLEKITELESKGIVVLDRNKNQKSEFCFFAKAMLFMNRHFEFIQKNSNSANSNSKIEDSKLIFRAKQVLQKVLNMSEEQAHRYIIQQSMNLRQSQKKTAEGILNTYE